MTPTDTSTRTTKGDYYGNILGFLVLFGGLSVVIYRLLRYVLSGFQTDRFFRVTSLFVDIHLPLVASVMMVIAIATWLLAYLGLSLGLRFGDRVGWAEFLADSFSRERRSSVQPFMSLFWTLLICGGVIALLPFIFSVTAPPQNDPVLYLLALVMFTSLYQGWMSGYRAHVRFVALTEPERDALIASHRGIKNRMLNRSWVARWSDVMYGQAILSVSLFLVIFFIIAIGVVGWSPTLTAGIATASMVLLTITWGILIRVWSRTHSKFARENRFDFLAPAIVEDTVD